MPLDTVEKISRVPAPLSTTSLTRAPMAARLDSLPSSLSLMKWFLLPGFWNNAVCARSAVNAPPITANTS